ncbi:tyrosine recombinase XerC [bacterium MnTg02]|nr:tyrosine recombinase XerC [bacterium MnTg02]
MKHKITKTTVDKVRDLAIRTGKRQYVFDVELSGFGLAAQPSGKASYFIEYRKAGKRRLTIGRHGPFTPFEARNQAKVLLGEVAKGNDIARELLTSQTVQQVFDSYLRHNAKNNRYWRELEQCVRHYAEPILDRNITSITRADIAALIDKATLRAPSAGRHLFSAMRPCFRWAVERGHIELSPCSELRAPPPPKARQRVLTDKQIAKVWHGSEDLGFPFSPLLKLLILTGQRRNEVAAIEWDEIDDDVWTIPGQRTKNGKLHEVDLHPLAMKVIETVPHQERLLFTTTGRTPASGFSKAKRNLDARLTDLPHWRFHDLRRTAASGMAALGILPNVIERILNHQSGVNSGLVGIYQRHEYRAERRESIMLWGDHVAKILEA